MDIEYEIKEQIGKEEFKLEWFIDKSCLFLQNEDNFNFIMKNYLIEYKNKYDSIFILCENKSFLNIISDLNVIIKNENIFTLQKYLDFDKKLKEKESIRNEKWLVIIYDISINEWKQCKSLKNIIINGQDLKTNCFCFTKWILDVPLECRRNIKWIIFNVNKDGIKYCDYFYPEKIKFQNNQLIIVYVENDYKIYYPINLK